MKDNWKRCLENCYPVLKNVPLRQTIPSMFHILVKSIMKKYKKVNWVMMKNPNNKKQILKVIPNDIWINHFTQVNKNNAVTQPTTNKEDRNNIHTNLSRNNSLETNDYDYDLIINIQRCSQSRQRSKCNSVRKILASHESSLCFQESLTYEEKHQIAFT